METEEKQDKVVGLQEVENRFRTIASSRDKRENANSKEKQIVSPNQEDNLVIHFSREDVMFL